MSMNDNRYPAGGGPDGQNKGNGGPAGNQSSVSDSSREVSTEAARGPKKGERGQKACSAVCAVGGMASAIAIAACVAVTCVLYGTGVFPAYAVGSQDGGQSTLSVTSAPDNMGGSDISYVSSGQGEPSDPSEPNSTDISDSSSTTESTDTSSAPVTSDNSGVSGGDGNNSTPESTGEVSSVPMPDMGEDPPERVTALMESELLRARERRIAEGLSAYPDTDIAIPSSDIAGIASAYGFTEEFLAAYNSGERSIPGVIMVPRA